MTNSKTMAMATATCDQNGVDVIDLGFDLEGTDLSTGQGVEVNLAEDLAIGVDTENLVQIQDENSRVEDGMPNLMKYLQTDAQDDRHDDTTSLETAPNIGTPTILSNTAPNFEAEVGTDCHTEFHENDDGSPNTEGPDNAEPSPLLADLITAALQETADERSTEPLQVDILSESTNSQIPENLPEPLQGLIDHVEAVETPAEAEVKETTNLELENLRDRNVKLATVVPPSEIQLGNDEENSIDAEIPAMTTIKQNNPEDDEEFDFDLPAQSAKPSTTETYTPEDKLHTVRQRMENLEMEIGALHVYEEGRYSAQPLETLQASVQATIRGSQNCFHKLEELKTTLNGISKDSLKSHEEQEFIKIQTWIASANSSLQNIQKLAHRKNAMVLERMREEQASLALLDQANASIEGPSDAMTSAAAEWDAVQTVTPELGDGENVSKGVSNLQMINFVEAVETDFNLSKYKLIIKTSVPRKGFSGFFYRLFSTKLQKGLHDERNQVFCLAACPYQDEYAVHWRILQTIYRRLTGAKLDCPRYGGHWEQIGFQGTDPSTDLRGCGILGLLQLLYMVCDPMIYPLVKDIYRLSLHETQNFPFCIMGINMTRIVIQALREDSLNKECNKRKSVLTVVNELYVAAWLQLYQVWKTQHKTIADTGFVMKDLEAYAKKNPQAAIAALNTHLSQNRSKVVDLELPTFKSVQELGDS